jgi:hypothetical protein
MGREWPPKPISGKTSPAMKNEMQNEKKNEMKNDMLNPNEVFYHVCFLHPASITIAILISNRLWN